MTISTSELYIVVTYISYDGISGDTEKLFTDRKEAEASAEESNEYTKKHNSKLKYSVMTLDDYISEVKSESYSNGKQAEREYGAGADY